MDMQYSTCIHTSHIQILKYNLVYSSASRDPISRDAYLITNSLFLSPYLLLHLLIQPLNFFVMRICFAVLTRKNDES